MPGQHAGVFGPCQAGTAGAARAARGWNMIYHVVGGVVASQRETLPAGLLPRFATGLALLPSGRGGIQPVRRRRQRGVPGVLPQSPFQLGDLGHQHGNSRFQIGDPTVRSRQCGIPGIDAFSHKYIVSKRISFIDGTRRPGPLNGYHFAGAGLATLNYPENVAKCLQFQLYASSPRSMAGGRPRDK